MATAALVDKDIEIGRQIVASLTRAAIPVTVYLWGFVSDEWLFIVATPLVDSKGALAAYKEVNGALQKAGLPDEIAYRRIYLMSPNDRELKLLEKQSKVAPYEAIRTVNASIAGRFVEDAYLYTGFIQINRLQNRSSPVFSIFYAPYEGPGGIVQDVKKKGDELPEFLRNELHISKGSTESALQQLNARGSATIPNVELRRKDLKRLGLI